MFVKKAVYMHGISKMYCTEKQQNIFTKKIKKIVCGNSLWPLIGCWHMNTTNVDIMKITKRSSINTEKNS